MRTPIPLALATLLALSACSDERASTSPDPAAAAPTPWVALVDADQLAAKIAAAKGRGLLVNLWAMW